MNGRKQKTLILFSVAQIIIVVLFSVVTFFTLKQLSSANKDLKNIAEVSIPTITQASSLNNQIQLLAIATSSLANANSEPARLLSEREISNAFYKINEGAMERRPGSDYLSKQMLIVNAEIQELAELVELKITQQAQLTASLNTFYRNIDEVYQLAYKQKIDQRLEANLLKILKTTSVLNQLKKLNDIRRVEEDILLLIQASQSLLNNSNLVLNQKLESLKTSVISDSGFIAQKINALRLTARTRGRDNFVRNLIADVASNLQYRTQLINKEVKRNAQVVSNRVNKQAHITFLTGAMVVLISVLLISFMYRKLIVRLVSLANQVEMASEGKLDKISMSGNDEISNLSDKFDMYLNTVRKQNNALRELSLSDPLTAIPNRRAFNNHLSDAINMSRRNHWSLSVLLIDVDYFKPYNDYYGHAFGDSCLRLVAEKLNDIVSRNTDFCARYGGEEFVCILPNTDAEGARMKAEELRKAVQDMNIPHLKSDIEDCITVSVGAATFPFQITSTFTQDQIVEEADKALYEAKASGRNRCSYHVI